MSILVDRLKAGVSDGRMTRDELLSVLDAGTDASGAATEELKKILPKFVDALEPEAAEELRLRENVLGVGFAPPPDLRNAPALKKVWSEEIVLSATANNKHPGVELVQRALMRIAVRENAPDMALPKFGADGDFGSET